MKKIFCLIIFAFVFSGCTARYELVINDDLSFYEKIIGLEGDKFYNLFHSSKGDVANSVMSPYRSYILEQNYSINEVNEDNLYGLSLEKKYLDYVDYSNNFKDYVPYYKFFNISEDNGIFTISLNNKIIDDNFSNRYIIDDGEIIITLPFKVIDENADKYDSKTNSYIWNFNLSDDNDIYIKFDSSSKESNKYSNIIVIVLLLLIIIFCFALFIFYRKKSLNKDNI